jgi:hypothetical protein
VPSGARTEDVTIRKRVVSSSNEFTTLYFSKSSLEALFCVQYCMRYFDERIYLALTLQWVVHLALL